MEQHCASTPGDAKMLIMAFVLCSAACAASQSSPCILNAFNLHSACGLLISRFLQYSA